MRPTRVTSTDRHHIGPRLTGALARGGPDNRSMLIDTRTVEGIDEGREVEKERNVRANVRRPLPSGPLAIADQAEGCPEEGMGVAEDRLLAPGMLIGLGVDHPDERGLKRRKVCHQLLGCSRSLTVLPYTVIPRPPSKLMAVPVMQVARSDDRNTTRPPNSEAWATRPSETPFASPR